MGLLSLFTRRNGEAEPPAQAEESETAISTPPGELLWRCGAMETYGLGEHLQAIRTGDGPPHVLPAYVLDFAAGCQEWKTLDAHVAYHSDRHGWDSLQVESLCRVLPELKAAGVLISTEQVLRRLTAADLPSDAESARISIVGFPTGGDRISLLERAIRSFAANLGAHGRHAQFLVADSSTNPSHTATFRARLGDLARELRLPLAFSSPSRKEEFARELWKAGACSYEAAEFALLDPLKTGFACGANRNALLLHGAGQMLCSIDDDVVCDLFSAPPSEHRLALFSSRDPFSRWLFPDNSSAESFARPATADFLAANEQMLGRTVRDLVQDLSPGECSFDNLRDQLLERMNAPALRVRSTFLGHLGDPGIPTSLYYLYYDGENRRRLTESEEHYRSVFGSRSVQTIVPTLSLGDASVSPGMAMGLDHRELLPPFFPVLHAEDFSWGAAAWRCCGSALMGHIPLAVRHAPPWKPILTPDDFNSGRSVVVFEWAHLLRYLILDFAPPSEHSDAQRTQALGRHLTEFATLSKRDFAHEIGKLILRYESDRLNWLERELREDMETPDFWRNDLERHLDNVRSSLTHEDFDIPLDLKGRGTPEEAREFMKSALGRYGQLLDEWPALVEGAAALRDSGRSLFEDLSATDR